MADTKHDNPGTLRRKPEVLVSQDKLTGGNWSEQDISRLFQELQVYQAELEMQVDELQVSAQALEIQKNKFKLLFDLAPVSYFVIDKQGIIQDINNSGIYMLGAAGKIMVAGKPVTMYIDPQSFDDFYLFLKQLFKNGADRRHVIRIRHTSGKLIDVQISGIIYNEPDGEPVCYLMLNDITELRQGELNLVSAKRKLEIALYASMTGIWEIDTATGQLFLDELCLSIFEFRPFDFNHKIETVLDRIHPDDRNDFQSGLRRSIVSNSEFISEFRVVSPVSSYTRYIQARAKGTDSKLFIGIMTDFTEKRQREEETNRLKAQQEQMILAAAIQAEEKEKKRISEALHDGVAQQLYALKLAIGQADRYTVSEHSHFNELLNKTISDIRNLSYELAPAILIEFGLAETLKEMAIRLTGEHLKLLLSIRPRLKNLGIDFQLCMYRIIQELVNNSMKHGHAKKITIGIKQRAGCIVLTVADDGIGFDIDNHASYISGTGLANIRNRLKIYHGELSIRSKVDKGTSVSIILKQFS